MCEQFLWLHICNLDVGAAAVNSSQLLVALLAVRFTKYMYVTSYMPCLYVFMEVTCAEVQVRIHSVQVLL